MGDPAVASVYYPGLKTHPAHNLAATQMDAFGGMVSVRFAGGGSAARAFLGELKLFSLAESLGGVESLASLPAAMTHASVPEEERARRGIDDALVRLSVGIEDLQDLLGDVDQALQATRHV